MPASSGRERRSPYAGPATGLTSNGLASSVAWFSAAADLGFLVQALPVAVAMWAGRRDPNWHPIIRRTLRVAFPTVTFALGLLALQLVIYGPAMGAIPLVPTVLGYLYLTTHNMVTQPGDPAHAKDPPHAATIPAALGLALYGMLRLLLEYQTVAAITTAVVGVVTLLLWRRFK